MGLWPCSYEGASKQLTCSLRAYMLVLNAFQFVQANNLADMHV
jgi:hypothetical protein